MAPKKIVRFVDQVFALWKLCLSFRKPNWELGDYPVSIRAQELDPEYQPPRFNRCSYVASIANWHLAGCGDTKDEAIRELGKTFQNVKAERTEIGTRLPRPGIRVPIDFASRKKITDHGALVDDFIHRVLEHELAWISDDSSLWDFHTNQTNDLLYAKISDVYGLDVSDIESATITEILERLEELQRQQGTLLYF